MKHGPLSETDRLIERALQHDRARLPESASSPAPQLLRRFSSRIGPSDHASLLSGSIVSKLAIASAIGLVSAGVVYFAANQKPAVSPRPVPRHSVTIHSVDSATPPNKPVFSALPHTPEAKVRHRAAAVPKPMISEDSLLRQEVARPIVIPPSDTARTTIHGPASR